MAWGRGGLCVCIEKSGGAEAARHGNARLGGAALTMALRVLLVRTVYTRSITIL